MSFCCVCRFSHTVRVGVVLMHQCLMSSGENGCLSSQKNGHRSPSSRVISPVYKQVQTETDWKWNKGSGCSFPGQERDLTLREARGSRLHLRFASAPLQMTSVLFGYTRLLKGREREVVIVSYFRWAQRVSHSVCQWPLMKGQNLVAWRAAWVASGSFYHSEYWEEPTCWCLPQSILRMWTTGCWWKNSTQPGILFFFFFVISVFQHLLPSKNY